MIPHDPIIQRIYNCIDLASQRVPRQAIWASDSAQYNLGQRREDRQRDSDTLTGMSRPEGTRTRGKVAFSCANSRRARPWHRTRCLNVAGRVQQFADQNSPSRTDGNLPTS